jgi:hypothetical protein
MKKLIPRTLMVSCRHAHELISEQMEQPLPPGRRIKLWLHLRICAACQRVESQLHFMREAVRRIGR